MMKRKEATLDRFNVSGSHVFELVETPKGLIQARIDGVPISGQDARRIRKALKEIQE